MTKAATDVVCLETPKSPRIAVSEVLKTLAETVAECRCRWAHRSISHPVAGKYRCWQCLREFDTDF